MSMDKLIRQVGPSLIQLPSWSGRIIYQLVFPSPALHLALSYPHKRLQAETRVTNHLSVQVSSSEDLVWCRTSIHELSNGRSLHSFQCWRYSRPIVRVYSSNSATCFLLIRWIRGCYSLFDGLVGLLRCYSPRAPSGSLTSFLH